MPAEEGLPGGEPLLLQHLEVCRAALEADGAAIAAGGAPAAAPVSLVAGGSHWAMVTCDALQTLGRLWGSQGAEPSAGAAAAVLRATMQLLGHEVAVRDLLRLSDTEAATAESDSRLLSALSACLRLRGAAAAAAQQSLLQQLGDALSSASNAVATAFLGRAPEAAASMHPPALPPPGEGSGTAWAQAGLPGLPPAASDPNPAAAAAMTALANSANCVAKVNAICVSSQGPQSVLAPDCESGHDWAVAIAGTLGNIACCFDPHAGSVPNDVLMTAFTAGSCLAGAAITLLRRRIAAGVEALQQAAGVQLVDGLAAYVACDSQPIFVAAAHVRSCSHNCISHWGCTAG